MNFFRTTIISLTALALFACSSETPPEPAAEEQTVSEANTPAADPAPAEPLAEEPPAPVVGIDQKIFGETRDGEKVFLYTLSNGTGMSVEIMNYGGIIRALTVPNRDGLHEDVVLGFDSLVEYEKQTTYFGAVIGRYANRIADGRFELDGEEQILLLNDGPNHLHGGERGFDKVVWEPDPNMTREGPGLSLRYVSEDGEEGYPGKVRVTVRYTLTYKNTLIVDYEARTDKPTPINLTNHSCFNLAGNTGRDILGQNLQIAAEQFTPVNSSLIPTGEYRSVEGTPFDFRTPKPVGADIDAANEQLTIAGGYDHNWVTDPEATGDLRRVATLSDPESGRVMSVWSEEPGLQVYSGNSLNGSLKGKGVTYQGRSGLCLQPQHFPDSVNQPDFPNTILRDGETYRSQTVYAFTTEK